MAKKETFQIELPEEGGSRRSGSRSGSSSRGGSNGRSSNHNSSHSGGSSNHSSKGKKKMTRSQKRRKRRRTLFIIEAVVLILLLAFLAVWLKLGMISWDDLKNLRTNDLDEETQEMLQGYTNIALFGVDNRSNGNYDSGNSDSIIICSINNDTKEVKLVSVYRDTMLDVDGDGTYRKCNYAYNHGGAEEAIEMLNRNLDLDIQKYVAVDFYALIEAIDAVGGIELDIDSDEAYYMNTYGGGYIANTANIAGVSNPGAVSTGEGVHVSGVQAVAYCRIRYTSGSDFKRAQRQRIVLEKLIDKAQNASVSELYDMANSMFDDIGTNFTLSQIVSMARYVKDYQLVDTAGFPFTKSSANMGGSLGSVVVPCTLEDNVRALHAYLFNNEEATLSQDVLDISNEIENMTGLDSEDAIDYGY
jgi:LCP family protein required for cell wall assembly